MKRTTAGDLLARADQLTRELCDNHDLITKAQWEQFDATLHRAMYDLVGAVRADPAYTARSENPLLRTLNAYPTPLNLPPDSTFSVKQAAQLLDYSRRRMRRELRSGNLHAVSDGDQTVLPASSLKRGPRIPPADPTEPHPLPRLSTALGAFADLICDNNRAAHPVSLGDAAVTDALRRVLTIGAVAAQHTLRHIPIDAVDRPLLIARYSSAHVDTLDPSPRRISPLDHIAAVVPVQAPMTIKERLDADLHNWRLSAHHEVQRLVPSTQALGLIANHGVRLYAVTHQLLRTTSRDNANPDAAQTARQLNDGGAALRDAEAALKGLTSLTTPTHDFVTRSRELFTTLQQVRELDTSHDARLDPHAALASLAHGCVVHAELVTAARRIPSSLLNCHQIYAPARTLPPAVERLVSRDKGKHVAITLDDVPDLGWLWDAAARKAPEVAAAVHRALAHLDGPARGPRLELGR